MAMIVARDKATAMAAMAKVMPWPSLWPWQWPWPCQRLFAGQLGGIIMIAPSLCAYLPKLLPIAQILCSSLSNWGYIQGFEFPSADAHRLGFTVMATSGLLGLHRSWES